VTDTCTARQTDAVGTALDCELPAGHEGAHEAHTTPDVTVTWTGGSTTDTDPQAARARRRHTIRWLISLASLTPAGRAELCTAVEAELADADQVRDALDTMCAEVRRLSTKLGEARTASDVLVQHDVTRKAMCDALGVGYHLNWQQIIDAAQRSHVANGEWQQESERRRAALSEALGLGTSAPWYAITDRAATVKDAAYERAELLESARDALSTAGQNGPHADDWPAIAPGIEALAAERDRARQGETEAVRAREAADKSAAHLRELFEAASRQRDASDEAARVAMEQRQQMAAERYAWQERGDRAEKRADLADRVKRTAAKDAAAALARADQAEATIARVRDECAAIEQERYGQHDEEDDGMREAVRRLRAALDGTGDAEPEDPCAHGCRDAADAHTRLSQDLDADAEPPTEPEGPVLHGPVPPQFAIRIDLSDTAIADAIRRAVQRASRYVQRHPGSPS
jgi:hypothetical protein